MAGAKKTKKDGPSAVGKARDGKPVVDRFESDWDGVPNFKLKPTPKSPKKATKSK